jgi:hypothetical protein
MSTSPGGIEIIWVKTQNYPGIPWMPGGFLEELTLFQKMLVTQNYPGTPGIPGIPGGFLEELTLFEKMLETQNYPGIPGIPGGFLEELTLVQKYQETQVTQEFLVYNDYFYFK